MRRKGTRRPSEVVEIATVSVLIEISWIGNIISSPISKYQIGCNYGPIPNT